MLEFMMSQDPYIVMPEKTPAPPKPLRARPMMKDVDVGAAADNTEPIMKTNSVVIKSVFMEYKV